MSVAASKNFQGARIDWKARATAAETRSAELARALNELIIAADSLATTANLSQADREIDRALSALAGHDAAIHTGDDDE